MAGGRPTKYKKEYIKAVYDYVDSCVDTEDEFHKLRGIKMDGYDRIKKINIPTIEGFSLDSKIPIQTLYLWGEAHPEFRSALDDLKREQKRRLFQGGLSGEYNPLIAKLILAANHGMSDKVEQEITHHLPKPILDFLDEKK